MSACAGQGVPDDDEPNGGGGGQNAGSGGKTSGGSGGSASGGSGGYASGGSGGSASGGSGGSASGGSGGSASGGSGGAQPGAGGGGTPAGNGSCAAAGATFCADFEGAALPANAAFFPEYLRNDVAKYVTLDATVAHGGTKSVKVTGTQFSQMLGVPVPGKSFWARVYLRSDTDIQQGHNTYVAAVEGNGDPNQGQAVRIGEHQCQLELNRKSDDKELLSNGGMYMCSGGVKLVASRWYCLEAFFDGAGGEVRVFIDKQEVTQLHATGWGPYDYKLFKFGFEKYHGGEKTLWYDDVAVGPARIGCTE